MTGRVLKAVVMAFTACALCACGGGDPSTGPDGSGSPPAPAESGLDVTVITQTLPNGLTVVMLPETGGPPTVTVSVFYEIGFRSEPADRTGYAHLFEHLMFQGAAGIDPEAYVEAVYGSGGLFNGDALLDFSRFSQVGPSSFLDTALELEAARMSDLRLDQARLDSQRAVLAQEARAIYLDRPYGGFPWLTLPEYAFENWRNARRIYADLEDIEAATVETLKDFYARYYHPGNAVLVIAGRFDPDQAMKRVRKHFEPIAQGPDTPEFDASEPVREKAVVAERLDPLAPLPALALAYTLPPRESEAFYAMALIDQILLQGEDSRLHRRYVEEAGIAASIRGGPNLTGNIFTYDGPALWNIALVHGAEASAGEILAIAEQEIDALRKGGPGEEELARAKAKFLAKYYAYYDRPSRFGLTTIAAAFALFDGDAARLNAIPAAIEAVTADDVRRAAQEYLRPEARTVLIVAPGNAQEDPS